MGGGGKLRSDRFSTPPSTSVPPLQVLGRLQENEQRVQLHGWVRRAEPLTAAAEPPHNPSRPPPPPRPLRAEPHTRGTPRL